MGCTEGGKTAKEGEKRQIPGTVAQEVLRSVLLRGHTLLFLWFVDLGCYHLLSATL